MSFFRAFDLTLSPECSKFLTDAYTDSNLILEYGSGGSTQVAATIGTPVITVESSVSWLAELVASSAELSLPGWVQPIWVDVGPTGDWGWPTDPSTAARWSEYSLKPWAYCDQRNLQPDTVLIDGRFRVGCFVATCINTTGPVRILFDDFVSREQYHCVTDLVRPKFSIGERMAVFDIEPDQLAARDISRFLSYFLDPE